MRRFLLLTLCGGTLGLAGCDSGDPGSHVPEPVVEAWLIAREPLPTIRLTWSQSVDVSYSSQSVQIQGATARVARLDEALREVASWDYTETNTPGVYRPAADPISSFLPTVEPGATYRLEVQVPGYGETVRATTVVPGDFEVTGVSNQTVVYQSTDQVEVNVTTSGYPGRDAVYVISILSLEPSFENLTPFLRDALYSISEGEEFDPEDIDLEDIDEVVEQSSPPLNEANWEVNPDGTLKLKMPWFFVAFYGDNEITASAIDDNIWTFLRQVNAQEGNGGLSPGEIPNVNAGIEGGHGLFGSLSRARSRVTVLKGSEGG